jgi:XTP/dITP diphosphohydrolase
MLEAIIASRNDGKIIEIKEILRLPGLKLLSYHDLDHWIEVEEDGLSYRENALSKASALVEEFGLAAIADDSGLEVIALNGAPGVLSARYAGVDATDEDNNTKLLKALSDVPFEQRKARYVCDAVFVDVSHRVLAAEGTCRGQISLELRGEHGFGYDPLFVPEGYNKTMAELVPEVKNHISHRGKAFTALHALLAMLVQSETKGE